MSWRKASLDDTRNGSLPPWRGRLVAICALLVASLALGEWLAAESDTTPEDAERLTRATLLYRVHCAKCHGDDGRGGGHLAAQLEISPPDLRTITRRNGNRFPAEVIASAIDGRAETETHGKRAMPIWGLTLQQAGRDSDQGRDVEEHIADLLVFLRSIQQPTD